MGQGVPVRVHGTDAILTVGAYLPDVCVKCGRKEGLVRRNLNLVRHPLWLYGLLALGLVPYLVARTGLTQGSASMCLCPLCLGRYSSAGMAEVVLAMPITGGLLVMGTVLSGVNDALGLGLLLVGLFVFASAPLRRGWS